MNTTPLLCAALALAAAPAFAQVKGHPVKEGSGPLREISTNAGSGSPPVYAPDRSLRAGSAGPLSGRAVAEATTGTVTSGTFSDVSTGPVTAHLGVSGGGPPGDASVGAVTRDANAPLRASRPLPAVAAEPVYDLGPLQQQLRAIEPLPREGTTTDEEAGNGEWEPQRLAQDEGPEVRQVEPPDVRDPGTLEEPEEPVVEPPREVGQPPEPPVGAPRESVPIQIEGQDSNGQ
jgi:hypothetical protein